MYVYVWIYEGGARAGGIGCSQTKKSMDVGLGEACGVPGRPRGSPGEPGGPSWRAKIFKCFQIVQEKKRPPGGLGFRGIAWDPWQNFEIPGGSWGDPQGRPQGVPRESLDAPGGSVGDQGHPGGPWGPRGLEDSNRGVFRGCIGVLLRASECAHTVQILQNSTKTLKAI